MPGDPAGAAAGVLVAVGGLSLFFGFMIGIKAAGWVNFELPPVFAVFSALIVLNLMIAPSARRWASWRHAAVVYEAVHAVVLTLVLHFLGGPGLGLFLVVYAFLVVHTEILRPDAPVFVTANICAICYASLSLLYRLGWLVPARVWDIRLSGTQEIAFLLFGALSLNFLALYVRRHGAQLTAITNHLRDLVAERTRDLTRVNRELSEKALTLERTQREREAFVYTVTHDLKAPITNMFLASEAFVERYGPDLPSGALRDIGQLGRLARRAESMLHDLLSVFRITSSNEALRDVSLGLAVREALEMLRPKITARGVRIDVEPLPVVRAKHEKLVHVFSNLLDNAINHVSDGTGRVRITGRRDEHWVQVCVADNGVGIPPEYHRAVFELFRQVPRSQESAVVGTGIGLAVVKQVVEDHGGEAWVESQPGCGARFFVRLPLVSTPNRSDSERMVLVADDDPDFVCAVRGVLEHPMLGCHVEAVATGAAAWTALEKTLDRHPRPVAAVILDLRLPDTDALAFLQRLQADRRMVGMPVMVMSSAFPGDTRSALREAGALRVEEKPSSRAALRDVVLGFLS